MHDYAAQADRIRDEDLPGHGEQLITTAGGKAQCPYTARTLPWTQCGSLDYAECGIHLVDKQYLEPGLQRLSRKRNKLVASKSTLKAFYKASDSTLQVLPGFSCGTDYGFLISSLQTHAFMQKLWKIEESNENGYSRWETDHAEWAGVGRYVLRSATFIERY
jgi:hypothetical protein